jgi:hypothetical protein
MRPKKGMVITAIELGGDNYNPWGRLEITKVMRKYIFYSRIEDGMEGIHPIKALGEFEEIKLRKRHLNTTQRIINKIKEICNDGFFRRVKKSVSWRTQD